jgi:hypothetical protein
MWRSIPPCNHWALGAWIEAERMSRLPQSVTPDSKCLRRRKREDHRGPRSSAGGKVEATITESEPRQSDHTISYQSNGCGMPTFIAHSPTGAFATSMAMPATDFPNVGVAPCHCERSEANSLEQRGCFASLAMTGLMWRAPTIAGTSATRVHLNQQHASNDRADVARSNDCGYQRNTGIPIPATREQ